MNNSPVQNHLNCHNKCIHHIDIIDCGFSIQPSYSELILPNLYLLTFIAFLQLFSGGLFWRQLRFGGNWLHIIFWQIVLEEAQIKQELAPHYFLTDCFGGRSDLEGTGSTLFSNRLFLRQLKFGGNWLHIIFWRIVLEAAQIWRELAPHYFPADCFWVSSDLVGTGYTLFSDRLFWRQLKFGGNWLQIIFWQIVLEAAQIWRELAPYYFPEDWFGNLEGTGSTLFCGGLFWKFGGNWLHIFFRRIVL